jgi:hypothetical protein
MPREFAIMHFAQGTPQHIVNANGTTETYIPQDAPTFDLGGVPPNLDPAFLPHLRRLQAQNRHRLKLDRKIIRVPGN